MRSLCCNSWISLFLFLFLISWRINSINNILSFPSIVLLISVFIILIMLLLRSCLITNFLLSLMSLCVSWTFSLLFSSMKTFLYLLHKYWEKIYFLKNYLKLLIWKKKAHIFNLVFEFQVECKRDCRKHYCGESSYFGSTDWKSDFLKRIL